MHENDWYPKAKSIADLFLARPTAQKEYVPVNSVTSLYWAAPVPCVLVGSTYRHYNGQTVSHLLSCDGHLLLMRRPIVPHPVGVEAGKDVGREGQDARPVGASPSETHVVVLVHGIRDYARWHDVVRTELEAHGFVAKLTNYGRFGIFGFLSPFASARQRATQELASQFNIVFQQYPHARISVIAHSFGTFLVSEILRQRADIRLHRVIFAGSVLKRQTPFENYPGRFTEILNEVGDRDPWPAFAESLTGWYGAAGTKGLRTPMVRDRFHADANHGYYLNAEFCRTFWVPFLLDGTVVNAAGTPHQSRLIDFLLNFPIRRWIPATVVFAGVFALLSNTGLLHPLSLVLEEMLGFGGPSYGVAEGYVRYETDRTGQNTRDGRFRTLDGKAPLVTSLRPGQRIKALDEVDMHSAPGRPVLGDDMTLRLAPDTCAVIVGRALDISSDSLGGWLPVRRAACVEPTELAIAAVLAAVQLGRPREAIVAQIGQARVTTMRTPEYTPDESLSEEQKEQDAKAFESETKRLSVVAELYVFSGYFLEVDYFGDRAVQYSILLRLPVRLDLADFPDISGIRSGRLVLGDSFFSEFWREQCHEVQGVSSTREAWATLSCDYSQFTNDVGLTLGWHADGISLPSIAASLYSADRNIESYPHRIGYSLLMQTEGYSVDCSKEDQNPITSTDWIKLDLLMATEGATADDKDIEFDPLLCFSMRIAKPNALTVTDYGVALPSISLPSGQQVDLSPKSFVLGPISYSTFGALWNKYLVWP